jgi:rhodanese-related sulfurtransferase
MSQYVQARWPRKAVAERSFEHWRARTLGSKERLGFQQLKSEPFCFAPIRRRGFAGQGFTLDPTLPHHNPVFSSGKSFIFYCASGGRSALAADTAQHMGLGNVSHLGGGFKSWKEANRKL